MARSPGRLGRASFPGERGVNVMNRNTVTFNGYRLVLGLAVRRDDLSGTALDGVLPNVLVNTKG